MKKLFLIFSLFFLFLSNNTTAQPYVGGEIGWECKTNGNYRFFMKFYQDCGFSVVGYTSFNLNTNVTGLSTIPLYLKTAYPKELSPICYSATPPAPTILCDSANTQGTGAVKEYFFTSDSIYPNGVQLNGVPPLSGWIFSCNQYMRAPSQNILSAGSIGYNLKAVMYPTYNQVSGICNDNSPTFAEPPKTILCTGFPTTFSNIAFDKDGDSLVYNWGIPTDNYGTPLTFASNYSYNSPLPGTYQSANNIPATLDSTCGLIKFKSVISGVFLTKTNVSSYRNGNKIAEVSREMEIVLQNCISNLAPVVSNPFPPFNPDVYEVELSAGDLLTWSISGTDFQFNPNTNPQIVKLEAVGDQFGSYIPASGGNQSTLSQTNGCSKPPCATLTSAPSLNNPLQAQFAVSTLFNWQTSTNHLGLNQQSKWYFFKISFTDDYCPFPAQTNRIIKVLVKPPYYMVAKPKILNTKVLNSNSDVKITWEKCKDSINLFNSYEIYSSTTKNGIYNLVDSVMNVNDTSLIHLNTAAGNNEIFYFSKIKYLYNGAFYYTQNSDTVTTQFVDLEVIDTYVQFINSLHGYVRCTIRNNGNTTVDTLIVHYYFGQGQFLFPKTITWTGVLQAKDTIQIPFPVDSISSFYSYTVCTFVSHPKDYVYYNDSTCRVNLVGLEDLDLLKLNIGKIHPSPSSGKLFIPIESQRNEIISIEIFNQQGMMIKSFKTQLNSGNNEIQIDLEKEENGVYFYVLEISGQSYFGKIVLVK